MPKIEAFIDEFKKKHNCRECPICGYSKFKIKGILVEKIFTLCVYCGNQTCNKNLSFEYDKTNSTLSAKEEIALGLAPQIHAKMLTSGRNIQRKNGLQGIQALIVNK